MFPGSSPAIRDLIKPASMNSSSAREPASGVAPANSAAASTAAANAAAANAAAANAAAANAARARAASTNSGSDQSSMNAFLNALQRSSGDFSSNSGRSSGGSGDLGMRSCGSAVADPNAMNTMIECANRKLSMASNDKAALVDYDQKVMFIVDRASKTVTGCVQVSTGKDTGSGKGDTPVGMMITGPHKGAKYQSNADGTAADAIGLRGTDPSTIARTDRGVVIHKAHGGAGTNSTLGCIGIEDSQFDKIKEILYGSDANPKKSAIFVHDKNSREKCDGGIAPDSGGSSGDTETGS